MDRIGSPIRFFCIGSDRKIFFGDPLDRLTPTWDWGWVLASRSGVRVGVEVVVGVVVEVEVEVGVS